MTRVTTAAPEHPHDTEAIEEWMRPEDDAEADANMFMDAADPVLAELWDNPRDAAYDRIAESGEPEGADTEPG